MKKSIITRFDVGFWAGVFTAIIYRAIDQFLVPNSLLNWIISIAIGTIFILVGQCIAEKISDE